LVRPFPAGVVSVDDPRTGRAGDGFSEMPHYAFVVIPVKAVFASDWVGCCAPADSADYRT